MFNTFNVTHNVVQSQLQADTIINEQFLPQLVTFGTQHLLIKSAKGSGKTTSLAKYVNNLGSRVLLVGHRRTLLKQQATNLGLTYYQDIKPDRYNKVNRLAVTLDSLHQLDPSAWQGCVLVLDEMEQVLKHLTGNTEVKNSRVQVLGSLDFIARNSKQVIGLDGDLTELAVEWLASKVGRENINVVLNERLPQAKTFVLEKTKTSAIDIILESLAKGMNVYVPSSSKDMVKFVSKHVDSKLPHVKQMVVTSENSYSKEIQEFLANVNEESTKYQLLIASPSLGTGVDISNNHFDTTVGLYNSTVVASASDILQHVARVRHLTTNVCHLWVSGRKLRGLATTAEQVAGEVNVANDNSLYRVNRSTGKFEPFDSELVSEYQWLYSNIVARHNSSVSNLKRNVIEQLQLEGHLVMESSEVGKGETATAIKQHADAMKEERVAAIAAAVTPTKDEVKELQSKETLTLDEQAKVDKYFYLHETVRDDIDLDELRWYVNDNGKSVVRNHKQTFVMTRDELHQQDVSELELLPQDRQRLAAKQGLRLSILKHPTLAKLFEDGSITQTELESSGLSQTLRDETVAIKSLLDIQVGKGSMRVVSSLLSQVGYDLVASKRDVKVNGKRTTVREYTITQESRNRMTAIAERLTKREELKRQQAIANQFTYDGTPITDIF